MRYNMNRRRYFFEEDDAPDWTGLPRYDKLYYHGARRGRGISNRIMAKVAKGGRVVGHHLGGNLAVLKGWGGAMGGQIRDSIRNKIAAIKAARAAKRNARLAARALG